MSGSSWFIIGVFVGTIFGVVMMAITSIAKQSDKQAESELDDRHFDKKI
ncbi:DUF3789 domain-containing protein [Cohnella panacarvi]